MTKCTVFLQGAGRCLMKEFKLISQKTWMALTSILQVVTRKQDSTKTFCCLQQRPSRFYIQSGLAAEFYFSRSNWAVPSSTHHTILPKGSMLAQRGIGFCTQYSAHSLVEVNGFGTAVAFQHVLSKVVSSHLPMIRQAMVGSKICNW